MLNEILRKDLIKFYKKFPEGIYIKTIVKPLMHGFFNDEEALKKEIEELPENTTLYFIGHQLKDIEFVPMNCFENIEEGKKSYI